MTHMYFINFCYFNFFFFLFTLICIKFAVMFYQKIFYLKEREKVLGLAILRTILVGQNPPIHTVSKFREVLQVWQTYGQTDILTMNNIMSTKGLPDMIYLHVYIINSFTMNYYILAMTESISSLIEVFIAVFSFMGVGFIFTAKTWKLHTHKTIRLCSQTNQILLTSHL